MSRALLLPSVLTAVALTLEAVTLTPGDRLVYSFTAKPNSADLISFHTDTPLIPTGTPKLTIRLYDGKTLLGTATTTLSFSSGFYYFTVFFAASGAATIPAQTTTIQVSSLNNGTIAGSLVVTVSDGSVTGLEAAYLRDGKSLTPGSWTSYADLTVTGPTLFPAPVLPHLAAGDTWTTGILVINTAAESAAYSIAFRDGNGVEAPLPFAQTASTLSGTLAPMGSAYVEAGNLQSPLIVAWGQVVADPSIVVHALFRNSINGTYYEAAVSGTQRTAAFEVPFDATTFAATNVPMYTGLAIANLDGTNAANVICTARDEAGTEIPNGAVIPAIKPLGHWSGYQFPSLTGHRGTLDCTSTTDVAALALRFIGTTTFSSLPVVVK